MNDMSQNASKNGAPLLSVDGLVRHFDVSAPYLNRLFEGLDRAYVRAVDGINFDIGRGETFSLVGESGCGKSTVARLIVGLYQPTRGSIKYEGVEIGPPEAAQDRRRMQPHMQMIFQDPYASLNPRMTVYDMLAEAISTKDNCDKQALLERVISLMDDVGLPAQAIRKYPHEFSGGQRQRIAIARALALKPRLLIADEPVSALDVTIQAQILELLLNLIQKYQITMIFISHDLSVIRYVTDRTAVMYEGKIVEYGETEEVFNHPQHPYTRSLLSAIPIADPIKERSRERIAYSSEIES